MSVCQLAQTENLALTMLREKRFKIVRHARFITFQKVKVAVLRDLLQKFVSWSMCNAAWAK